MPEQPEIPVDKSLTPQNAAEKGYLWLYDIYDGMVNDLLVKSMIEDGYKLGAAEYTNLLSGVGIYRPLKAQPLSKK